MDLPYKLEPSDDSVRRQLEFFGLRKPEVGDVPLEEPVEVEARRLVGDDGVAGPRQNDYGNPLDDFSGTAQMWSGLLLGKLKEDITPEEVAMMMVCLKLRRETHYHKRDSIVDGIGYLICLDRVKKEKDRRG